MVTLIKSGKQVNVAVGQYCGLSTDTKPTDAANGSSFIEIDTGKVYLFDAAGETWNEI